jgi:hypothetical protein
VLRKPFRFSFRKSRPAVVLDLHQFEAIAFPDHHSMGQQAEARRRLQQELGVSEAEYHRRQGR